LGIPGLYKTVIYTTEENEFRRGFQLTLLLSVILLFAFYGNLLLNLNNVYFGKSGDGLQSYYGTIYQAKHDSTYWHLSGMNYPYGENSFFTGNQPLLTAFIKLVSNTVYDISGYSVGIVNFMMLLAIVICALSIFGIFNHLKIPWLYASLAAIGIAFLSPQVQRMGGHYSLAYPFAIPLFMLLLLKFSEKPGLKGSFTIAILTFFMAGTHLYFFGIYAMILGFYYLIGLIRKEKWFKNIPHSLLHFSVQSILPFLAVLILTSLNNSVIDRPQSPWGFLVYKTNWKSIFLPVGRPMGQYFAEFLDFSQLEWEGVAFVGFVGAVFTILIAGVFIFRLFKKRWAGLYDLTGHPLLNLLFWVSILALMYSFGIPFIFKLEFLLDYLGMVKQMRGIGRFAWVFFYVINIVAFYMFYQWFKDKDYTKKWILLALPLTVLLWDGWISVRAHEPVLNNHFSKLDGTNSEFSRALADIDFSKYQAIIPLPCFAIGSENVWISPGDALIRETLILSIATGLPTTGSCLARTSISQTYKHLQLTQEAYVEPTIFADFKSEKPFLIIAIPDLLKEPDLGILKASNKLFDTDDFSLYEISYSDLKGLYKSTKQQVQQSFEREEKLFEINGFLASDSILNFFYDSFENGSDEKALGGSRSFKGRWNGFHRMFDNALPNMVQGVEYTASFWFHGYYKDLYSRAVMEIAFIDTINHKTKAEYAGIHQKLSILDGDWALVEWKFVLPENTNQIQFTIWNDDAKPEWVFFIDDFLIRPSGNNLYMEHNGQVSFKNNRRY
jgi:hypothetical protein